MADAIVIDALTGGYENNTLFQRISLSFPKGAFIALAGPNGSGKSSLLKFFYKQLKPRKERSGLKKRISQPQTGSPGSKHRIRSSKRKLDFLHRGRDRYDGPI